MRTNNENRRKTDKPSFEKRGFNTDKRGSNTDRRNKSDERNSNPERKSSNFEKRNSDTEKRNSNFDRKSSNNTDRFASKSSSAGKFSREKRDFNNFDREERRENPRFAKKDGRTNSRFSENERSGERKSFGEKKNFGEKRNFGERSNYDDRKNRYDDRNKNEERKPRFEDRQQRNEERRQRYEDKPLRGEDKRPRYEDSNNDRKNFGKDRFEKPQRRERDASYNPDAKYSLKKQIEHKKRNLKASDPIRLNRFLANAGICSRREADDYIRAGVVTVNGEVVSELGTKVTFADKVLFHDQLVRSEKKIYILINKPKDCITTSDDPQERFTVMDLVKDACSERIYPVGRLDRNTTGVLLLTNDGELAAQLTHPKYNKKKIYHVFLDKPVTKAHLEDIANGIELEDGKIHADAISYADENDKKQVGIEIHSGRNRIVRRIFEHLGYQVEKLDRVYFAGLTKKNLPRGKYRFLTEKEINMLRMGAFE